MYRPSTIATFAVLFTTLAVSGNADALTVRESSVSPTGVCAPATPGDADGLRFRPLGIYNASDSGRYVSCSLPIDNRTNGDSSPYVSSPVEAVRLRIGARNSNPVDRYLDCTINTGARGGGNWTENYNIRFRLIANVGASRTTPWYTRSLQPRGSVNIICLLPAKVELTNFDLDEKDDDNQF
ncbi:hypothetical protein [Lysobacter sp. A3-1-A15]